MDSSIPRKRKRTEPYCIIHCTDDNTKFISPDSLDPWKWLQKAGKIRDHEGKTRVAPDPSNITQENSDVPTLMTTFLQFCWSRPYVWYNPWSIQACKTHSVTLGSQIADRYFIIIKFYCKCLCGCDYFLFQVMLSLCKF